MQSPSNNLLDQQIPEILKISKFGESNSQSVSDFDNSQQDHSESVAFF
jgi:hypothetical protein